MSVLYITRQGAYLRKQAGKFAVTYGDELLDQVPQAATDGVVLFGYVQVSTQAMHELLKEGIPLVYLTRSGRFLGLLRAAEPRNPVRRIAQYDCVLDDAFRLEAARGFVRDKLTSQKDMVRRWQKSDLGSGSFSVRPFTRLGQLVSVARSVDALRGLEAHAARLYFEGLSAALPAGLEWYGRNRRPPRDPVNALLSLTYSMMLGVCIAACYAVGLDPAIGFLHQFDYGRPSLALDLLEPLRASYADRFVVQLLQAETLVGEDFTTTQTDGCRLCQEPFRTYVRRYSTYMEQPPGGRLPLARAAELHARRLANAIRLRESRVTDSSREVA